MRGHLDGFRRLRRPAGFSVVWALRASALLLLLAPILLVVVSSFGAHAYTTIPPTELSLRWYANIFARDEFTSSFLASLGIAAIVTPVSVLTGTLAAYGMWKYRLRLSPVLEPLLMSPILLPLVVTGLALLAFINRVGLGPGYAAIALGHVIITFPYSFRSVLAALRRYDRQMDDAAASLRARPWDAFRHVTLPLIRPGLFAGALFAFVMSFDDFAMTIFLIAPGTGTLPIAIYQYMEFNLDPTVSAVSTLLILMAIGGVWLVERTIGMERFIGTKA
ncbi:hypothetical protein CAL26_22570 [Bordetella genomosp. 9]|uniref:ABC transmembrane type-1 domain-containing protein n=1 Tax=Bordetella genomosp. 9 TaxID=1416803 RepID=A0A261R5M8_9BORD|nr:ABC transporter permease [Bordetella genomosp. 9]OZI20319.1 hypothetical protein CAL26_22570 [Bordetella genomosp. 9]